MAKRNKKKNRPQEQAQNLVRKKSELSDAESASARENRLNEVVSSLCESKAEEFRLLGYEHVTGREIWECVSDQYNGESLPQLHAIVNDILSLKVTRFMNWMTLKAYKLEDL